MTDAGPAVDAGGWPVGAGLWTGRWWVAAGWLPAGWLVLGVGAAPNSAFPLLDLV